MSTPRELGSLLRAARQQAGESQQQTADALRVTRQWLARVEAGTGNPGLRTVFALCDHLGVHLTVVGPRRSSRRTTSAGEVDLDVLLATFTHGAAAPVEPARAGD